MNLERLVKIKVDWASFKMEKKVFFLSAFLYIDVVLYCVNMCSVNSEDFLQR